MSESQAVVDWSQVWYTKSQGFTLHDQVVVGDVLEFQVVDIISMLGNLVH